MSNDGKVTEPVPFIISYLYGYVLLFINDVM